MLEKGGRISIVVARSFKGRLKFDHIWGQMVINHDINISTTIFSISKHAIQSWYKKMERSYWNLRNVTLKSLFENSYSHRIETEDGGRNVNFNLP